MIERILAIDELLDLENEIAMASTIDELIALENEVKMAYDMVIGKLLDLENEIAMDYDMSYAQSIRFGTLAPEDIFDVEEFR